MTTDIKIKNLLLSFILLGISMPLLQGQTELKEFKKGAFKITVKKYEVIQTEIYTLDDQLVYANTDMMFVGEETGLINLENLSKKPGLKPNAPADSNLLINNTTTNSILFTNNNTILTKPILPSNRKKVAIDKEYLTIGYTNNDLTNLEVNLASLSIPENRTITELPGYVPLTGIKFKLK